MRFLILISLIFASLSSQARVFSYKDESLAAYIHAVGDWTNLSDNAYAGGSGASTTVSGSSSYNYGGEVGVLFGLSPKFHARLGAELLSQKPVVGGGTDASGTSLFTVNSSVLVFTPNLSFEYVLKMMGDSRIFLEGGAGYSTVSVSNAYKMTTAGTSALGVTDFTESYSGTGISGTVGIGFETLFTDNATLVADFGYRYMPASHFKYTSSTTNIVAPSGVKSGDSVVNSDGSARSFNLGGGFVGVGFRFYLN